MESEKKESEVHSEHTEHSLHHKKTFTEKIRENPWIISTFVFGIIVIILMLGTFFGGFPGTGNVVSTQSAGNDVVNFLNKYIVPSGGVTLNSVQEDKVSGIYYANLTYNGKTMLMPVSKDGKYTDLGGGMINMVSYGSYMGSNPASSTSSSTTPTSTAPKTDKPTVELYVFAYCPYGLQMEKAMIPVVKLLGNNINFAIRQIGAMHGDFEKTEAQRQLCIEKNYPDKYLDYVLAFAQDTSCTTGDSACVLTKTTSLFSQFGIDASKINACMTTDGVTMYNAEVANANSKGVSGSPTLLINGADIQADRSQSGVLTSICSAFNTSPSACSQTLSTTQTAAGFGTGTSSGASASCGTA